VTEFIHSTPNLDQERFAHLTELQSNLVSRAHEAYAAESFDERNGQMALAVTNEVAELAGESLARSGVAVDTDALRGSFYAANLEAGQAFAGAFNVDGSPRLDNKDNVRVGQKAAGAAALWQLPGALHAANLDVADPQALLNTMTFQDVVRLTAAQLVIPTPANMDPDAVRLSLRGDAATRPGTVSRDDYFYDTIGDLPLHEAVPLTMDAERALDVAVRLFNATWKTGQVHVAANEGKDDRINPQVREAFNPYDLLKTTQYQRLIAEGHTTDDATLRVAFEVWKDVAQGHQSASPEDVAVAQAYRVA
jgi:hypothetical protein